MFIVNDPGVITKTSPVVLFLEVRLDEIAIWNEWITFMFLNNEHGG